MFAIYCDDAVHAIMATYEDARELLGSLMDSDGEQAHTWAIHPVSVSYKITK